MFRYITNRTLLCQSRFGDPLVSWADSPSGRKEERHDEYCDLQHIFGQALRAPKLSSSTIASAGGNRVVEHANLPDWRRIISALGVVIVVSKSAK
jgi:hypothetical protein